MIHNKPIRPGYKVACSALVGAAIFLCAFSVMPLNKVTRAPGVANADVKVLGTSNLPSWAREDKDPTCSPRFTYEAGKTVPTSLAVFTFSFPGHSLTSGKSDMDSKAYDAMKAKKGGDIVFAASSST